MAERGTTLRERRLAGELRHLRERATLTLDEVAEQAGWSNAKVSRMETGHRRVKVADLKVLLDLYEVADDKRETLLRLARTSRQRGWWDAYPTLPSDYATYISLEAEAASLRTYDAMLVNGLFQTPEYAREVIRAGLMNTAPATEIDRRLDVRLTRQRVLSRDQPLELWTILDENALRRTVGGPEVMRAQYQRLLEIADTPNITLQVLPHDSGAHAGIAGPFAIVEFPQRQDPDVVYTETAVGALWVEDDAQVHRYNLIYTHLRAKALDPDKSKALLARTPEDHV